MSATTPPPCLICGAPLAPMAAHWTTPPWHCAGCSRGWWSAELTPTARAAWRPQRQDFRPAHPLRAAVTVEVEQACQRGVSVRPGMVDLLTPAQAAALLRLRVTHPLAALLAAKAKG